MTSFKLPFSLEEANKLARYERSKQLLRKYPERAVDFRWFSDEKLFTTATPRNSQNDRLYVHSAVKKRDVAGRRLLSTRPTFSRSVMVSVAVIIIIIIIIIIITPLFS